MCLTAAAGFVLLLILGGMLSGCTGLHGPDPVHAAENEAVAGLRSDAANLRLEFTRMLRDGDDGAAAVGEMKRLTAPDGGYNSGSGRTLLTRSEADQKDASVDLTLFGAARGTGEVSDRDFLAELCVRLTGRSGPGASAQLTEIPCPVTPPPGSPAEPVDVVVTPSTTPAT